MRLLYVCTANVCRSVSAAALMQDAVDAWGLRGIQVSSAGSMTEAGMPGCTMAPALYGRSESHLSQPLDPGLVQWAQLILTAARENQAGVTALDPSARNRTFTIRQAGRLSQWLLESGMVEAARWRAQYPDGWEDRFEPGDPRQMVSPMPAGDEGVTGWLIEELDAARGVAPISVPAAAEVAKSRWRRSRSDAEGVSPDDIADPHTSLRGSEDLHPAAYAQIWEATNSLVALLRDVQGLTGEPQGVTVAEEQ